MEYFTCYSKEVNVQCVSDISPIHPLNVKAVKLYESPNIYQVLDVYKDSEDTYSYSLKMTLEDIEQGLCPIELFSDSLVQQKFDSFEETLER